LRYFLIICYEFDLARYSRFGRPKRPPLYWGGSILISFLKESFQKFTRVLLDKVKTLKSKKKEEKRVLVYTAKPKGKGNKGSILFPCILTSI
jgi:hypothetical protein